MQVFFIYAVDIDFLKILKSGIISHVYAFLWLWTHFEVHERKRNVIDVLYHFSFFDSKVF